MDNEWYIQAEEKPQGPYSPDQIRAMLQAGKIGLDTQLVTRAAGRWLPLREIDEFANLGLGDEPVSNDEDVTVDQLIQTVTCRIEEDYPTTEAPKTLLDGYRLEYEAAMLMVDQLPKVLTEHGKEAAAILAVETCINKIVQIHGSLFRFYYMFYAHQETLKVLGSGRLEQLGHPLLELVCIQSRDLPPSERQLKQVYAMRRLEEQGYKNAEHWLVDPWLLSEVEYMLSVLTVLIEPEFVPLDGPANAMGSTQDKPSRYIPASVKLAVWRRDRGRCVECGSQEKLEYDHIIPVAKGGSNTERNVQLLCEKCNRQKGASIA